MLSLLPSRRFGPLFWTQFLGAFNDNLFKNALLIMIAYQALSVWGLASAQLVALSAGIFILPFFAFSATAGQLADKYAKPRLIRWCKLAEILIMGLAAIGFLTGNLVLLLAVLLLMGTQSAFFGPAKYSVLPELLGEAELVGGNALVETGTFIAILLGTIAGGVLIAGAAWGPAVLATAVLAVAVAGWLASMLIPITPRAAPGLNVDLNPVTPMLQTFRAARGNRPVFLSILGISWFWFFGASLLTLLPSYCKDVLVASEHVVTFLLALFCVGIAVGALLCERMSAARLELGLVPLGSIGMTLFALDLFLAGEPYAGAAPPGALVGLAGFLAAPGGIRIAVDFGLLAVFSGFYTVPLYTMIQQRSEARIRARIIAANNILSAAFMVASSLLLMGLYALAVPFPWIFALLALANAAVATYIYTVIPEFALRFAAWVLASILYRVKVIGREHFPATGPAVLVCNHVTYVDWLIIASACKRPARFVMYHKFLEIPVAGWFFRDAKVIPIAPAREDSDTMEAAFERIARELEAGELVCIFPEGQLTRDGRLQPFRGGIERIIARTPVPVIPMALAGMWGSYFSHKDAPALTRPFRRWWSKVTLRIGAPIQAREVTARGLAEHVAELGGWDAPATRGGSAK